MQRFNFEVLSWSLYVGSETFEGVGPQLTEEAKKHLMNAPQGGVVSILLKYIGPDGNENKLGGVFSQ